MYIHKYSLPLSAIYVVSNPKKDFQINSFGTGFANMNRKFKTKKILLLSKSHPKYKSNSKILEVFPI